MGKRMKAGIEKFRDRINSILHKKSTVDKKVSTKKKKDSKVVLTQETVDSIREYQ